jgi:hypothetical protein
MSWRRIRGQTSQVSREQTTGRNRLTACLLQAELPGFLISRSGDDAVKPFPTCGNAVLGGSRLPPTVGWPAARPKPRGPGGETRVCGEAQFAPRPGSSLRLMAADPTPTPDNALRAQELGTFIHPMWRSAGTLASSDEWANPPATVPRSGRKVYTSGSTVNTVLNGR